MQKDFIKSLECSVMIGEFAIFEDSGYIPHLPRILEEANSQWLIKLLDAVGLTFLKLSSSKVCVVQIGLTYCASENFQYVAQAT